MRKFVNTLSAALVIAASLFATSASAAQLVTPVQLLAKFDTGSIVASDGVTVRDFVNAGLSELRVTLNSSREYPDSSTSYAGTVAGYPDSWVEIKFNPSNGKADMTINLHASAAVGTVSSNYYIEASLFVSPSGARMWGAQQTTFFRNGRVDAYLHSNVEVAQAP